MKDRECIHCEKFFDCKGKENNKPCLHYEERKAEKNGENQQQTKGC